MAGEKRDLTTQEYAWIGETASNELEDLDVALYRRWRAEQLARPRPTSRPYGALIANALGALALGALVAAFILWAGGRL